MRRTQVKILKSWIRLKKHPDTITDLSETCQRDEINKKLRVKCLTPIAIKMTRYDIVRYDMIRYALMRYDKLKCEDIVGDYMIGNNG